MTREIALGDVRLNPRNPRETVRDGRIEELAESIEQQGLLQPVTVRPVSDGYELVHGERRYRAVSQLGGETIRAEIRDLSDREALEASVTENLQREDVTAIAEAQSYRALIDEFGLTQTEAADRLGKSQSHISNRLKLLELPEELQEDILHQIFTPWQARELARVWGEYWLSDFALDWDLSVKELRRVVDELQDGAEQISISREWERSVLDEYWSRAGDDIDGRTRIVSGPVDDPDERVLDNVRYLDRLGEPVTVLHEAETTHGLHWARENIDELSHIGDRERTKDLWEGQEVRPIRIYWPRQRIILGYSRLSIAEDFEYGEGFEVELLFPADFFDWQYRRPDMSPPDAEREAEGGEA
jgi:ParB/RepB/Spo0J family partition protein